MQATYDVIVVGGGTAGVVAAIQAERAGARTLLIEKNAMLGGTMTMGGIAFPGLFHAWGHQVIAGIGWELVERCVREAGGVMPDFTCTTGRHWTRQVRINPALYAALCDEAVVDAGVDLLFHTMIAGVTAIGDRWQVTLCTKTGLATVTASVVIDATGDANATSLAGLPVNIPEETQPATLCCHAEGYDLTTLDLAAINRAYQDAVQRGELQYTDAGWNMQAPNVGHWLASHGNNANHLHHINGRDSTGRTQLELAGRQSILRLYRFLRAQPGLEALRIEHLAPECGVRETATIVGKATVTVQDYLSGRRWDDALCYTFYPIDLHASSATGIQAQPLAEGVVPTIPRGAMLPKGSCNFLVAGRCIASDRLANSALRVQATAMATGQAAGALAALAVHTGLDPEDLPLQDIRSLLRKHGAVVPG